MSAVGERAATVTELPAEAGSTTWIYRVVGAVSKPLIRLLFRPVIRGLENLPSAGGFVLSANQLSNLDGWALCLPLLPRQARWMGKAELFVPPLAPLMRGLGIFPVRRGEGDVQAVATAARLARSGQVVGIFPEGTRRRKGIRKKHEARPHTGAARAALAAGVPLVPAAVAGTDSLTRLRRWRVAYGSPIPVEDLHELPARVAARKATRRLWWAVLQLEAELAEEARAARTPLRLHPRLRLDVTFRDLFFALGACLFATRRRRLAGRVLAATGDPHGLPCLSVRSGLDLLLQALDLPAGSEVLVSAVTHPDMVGILEAHGLRAIPVDLDLATLAPRVDLAKRAVTPQTRMVLVAHLFGSRIELSPLAQLASKRDLMLVEDCAQSLSTREVKGDRGADVSLFSFGSIKTATALGGAVARVRDPGLLRRMRELHDQWPVQPRLEHAAKTAKFIGLALVSRPLAYGLFARACKFSGRDLDAFVNGTVRAFGDDLFQRIRRRPSAPLLALMARRLRRFDAQRLSARARRGERVAHALPAGVFRPGGEALSRTHWVFPVLPPDRDGLIADLRRNGIDASRATSSIEAVGPPADRPALAASEAQRLMAGVVFLPVYPELPEQAVARLLDVVGRQTAGA
jgi:dTDP-4-amino-4,6-dideoxygalactose transaminase